MKGINKKRLSLIFLIQSMLSLVLPCPISKCSPCTYPFLPRLGHLPLYTVYIMMALTKFLCNYLFICLLLLLRCELHEAQTNFILFIICSECLFLK